MKKELRLDKYLADMGVGTRSEVKTYARKGRVTVNGQVIKAADYKIDIISDEVLFDNNKIGYVSFEYYMLNKPVGVVSASSDNTCQTVIDLIDTSVRKDLFPVGRLDKDTEGLLVITNDGDLAHRLLSPKKHVGKVYYAEIEGVVTHDHVVLFKDGLVINEDFTALPAELHIIESGELSRIELTIYEGKFHQVKRMFEAVSMQVTYLKRLSMGELLLDKNLQPGEYRKLTAEEIKFLYENNKNK